MPTPFTPTAIAGGAPLIDYSHDFGYGPDRWWWLSMVVITMAFLMALGWLAVMLLRHQRIGAPGFERRQSPEEILSERFARGEIEIEDYQIRLETLRKHR